jgi:hypothetical protein
MKAKPIREPKDVDLTIEGGDLSPSDLKLLRKLISDSKDEIAAAQKLFDSKPWMNQPIPTLKELQNMRPKQRTKRSAK